MFATTMAEELFLYRTSSVSPADYYANSMEYSVLFFLFVLLVVLFLCGKPLFFMELSIGQYCSLGPWSLFRRLTPLSGGIGIAMILMNIIVLCYYSMITSISVKHLQTIKTGNYLQMCWSVIPFTTWGSLCELSQ